MTDEEIIAVVTAHKEGKTIEFRFKDSKEWGGFTTGQEPSWDFALFDYRVKPEPHYRPFENAEEVMEAIKEHGSWVKVLISDWRLKIIGCSNKQVDIGTEHNIPMSQAYIAFKFLDGTPFGKLEE